MKSFLSIVVLLALMIFGSRPGQAATNAITLRIATGVYASNDASNVGGISLAGTWRSTWPATTGLGGTNIWQIAGADGQTGDVINIIFGAGITGDLTNIGGVVTLLLTNIGDTAAADDVLTNDAAYVAGLTNAVPGTGAAGVPSIAGRVLTIGSNQTVYGSGTLTNSAVSGGLLTLSGNSTLLPTFGLTSGTVFNVVIAQDGAGSGLDADLLDGITSAGYVQTNRAITAGLGINGGGTLDGNIALSILPGLGIVINADDVAIDPALVLTNNSAISRLVNDSGYLLSGATNGLAAVTYVDGSTNTLGAAKLDKGDTNSSISAVATGVNSIVYFGSTGRATNQAAAVPTFNASGATNIPLTGLQVLPVTNNQTGVTLGGTFSGSGAGLTNLNANSLTGAVPASVSVSAASVLAPGTDGQLIYNSNTALSATSDIVWSNAISGLVISPTLGISNLNATARITVTSTSAVPVIEGIHYGNNSQAGMFFRGLKARGSYVAPAVPIDGDALLLFNGGGFSGTNFVVGKAQLTIRADGTWSPTSTPARLVIELTPSNSVTKLEYARWNNAGNLMLNTTTDTGYRLNVSGTSYVSGKGTFGGGVDPPYLTLDPQTRQSAARQIKREVPDQKLAGAHLFFNKSANALEFITVEDGTASLYRVTGTLVTTIALPNIGTERAGVFYSIDPDTGNVMTNRTKRVSEWRVKSGYEFDAGTGTFYALVAQMQHGEITWIRGTNEVPKSTAIEQVNP